MPCLACPGARHRFRVRDDRGLGRREGSVTNERPEARRGFAGRYEVHLSDKVQFLLDAMVGLIGISQNDIFKILTIVSIVGIPPTLIAGIYGMNFKTMPEYDWAFGYPYGLAMIAFSAIIPLVGSSGGVGSKYRDLSPW